jgi:hypothetical protein
MPYNGISRIGGFLWNWRLLIPLLFFLSSASFAGSPEGLGDTLLGKTPLKVKGKWVSDRLTISDQSILFEDTLGITHRIRRLLSAASEPVGYVSHIETPVCSDTLCALMDIKVFWSLAGGYWGFDTIPMKPLTKNDHLKFDEKDYEKLHELLLDEQSILRRRHKDDLFEKEQKRVSQVVDAVTGATAKEVKEAVVDGAVYSSYTIYHLVHSQLSAVIREDLEKHLWDQVKGKMSKSERIDERVFFTRKLPQSEFLAYRDEILETVARSVPRDRLYVMKKMPKAMWEDQEVQARIAEMTEDLDIHSLSHFLNELKESQTTHLLTLQKLGENIHRFSLNQLKTFLSLVDRDERFRDDAVIQQAVKKAYDNTAYVHRSFLKPYVL